MASLSDLSPSLQWFLKHVLAEINPSADRFEELVDFFYELDAQATMLAEIDSTAVAGVLTLVQSVVTARGEGAAPDNIDTIEGSAVEDSSIFWSVTGAEAITYRDFSVGAGNIATHGDTSIVTATGDVVMGFRTGNVVHVFPFSVAAGTPAGDIALAEGSLLVGNSSAQAAALDVKGADKVPVGNGTTVTTMTLPTTGLVAKTAAGTAAGRTITGTADQVNVSQGDGVAGNPTLSLPQSIATTSSPEFAGLTITGDILHQGGSFLGDAEQIDLRANYLLQNTDYVAAVGVTAGLVANYLPTATADTTVGAGVVTAGVDGVSDPTITTVGAATFAATDIVMISGSDNDGENDGIFEVQGHAGNVLTLKSTDNGVSNRVEAFTLDQVTANAGDVGMAITKITVTVLRTGADGIWEVGSGSQTGIVYSDLLRASDVGSIAQAYDASLVSLAALATAADKLPYATALDTYAETGLTAYARTLLDDADAATARATLGLKDTWTMAVLGAWAIDGDGANTNGAGLVGAVPTLTEAAVSQAKVENGGVFGDLSAVNAGYGATYQLFPDAPVAETDYCYFGRVVQFCEIAFDMSATVATFDAAGVLAWEYWTGAAWATLTVSYNGTSTTTKTDGSLAFGQDGALSFVPPADWAQTAVDGVTIFWVRCGIAAGKAANLTAVPITNAKQHEVVSPEDGFYCPLAGTITAIRLSDNAAVLHTTADVEFIVMNHTSGDHSGVLTFAMDRRTQRFSGLTLAVAAGDRLGVLVVTEDTAAEPTGCVLELEVTL